MLLFLDVFCSNILCCSAEWTNNNDDHDSDDEDEENEDGKNII
jgi:hypothetical protein